MPRNRLPIVWGQGLDRATGTLAVDKATFLDLRNLVIRDSKLLSRGGIVPVGDPFTVDDTTSTDIVGMFPFRAQLGMIIVTYDRVTRSLDVWGTDGFGESPTLIGNWDTLITDAPMPIVSGGESFGKFFLAHAEPLINFRARTVYYDPSLDPGSQLVDYDQDLDGGGSAHTFFRGVYPYLDYLMCYGFGSAGDPNRPELIHFTLPGDPTTMDPQQYFIAGALGEAVTGLGAVNGVLRVNKKGRSYMITGTGAADFGIFPLEEVYGQINDRASFSVGNMLYQWSEQGPRVCGQDGASAYSADIALPLELDGPPPASLLTPGDDAYCWSVYEPQQRIGLFAFPQVDPAGARTLVYVVSLRQPGVIRWGYYEISKAIYSACLVIEGAPSVGSTLTAFASDMDAADTAQSGTGRTVHLSWSSNALIGGETAQVIATNSEVVGTGPHIIASLPATAGTMAVDLPGLLAFAKYHLAVRYVKGGFATAGYESLDPTDWTAGTAAGSKVDVTTSCSAITGLAAAWRRTSATTHVVDVSYVLPELGQGFQLQMSPDGATWTDIETPAAPYDARVITHAMLDADIGTTKHFRLRTVGYEANGAYVAIAGVYVGPLEVPDVLLLVQDAGVGIGGPMPLQLWLRQMGVDGDKLQIQTSADEVTWSTRFSSADYLLSQPFSSSVLIDNTVKVRARYLHTSFGVDDPGIFTGTFSILYSSTGTVPDAPIDLVGVWTDDNAVTLTFDAFAAGNLVAVYARASDEARTITTVDHTVTEMDITDIRDHGTTAFWQPNVDNTQNSPDLAIINENVFVYPVDETGGRFLVGAPAELLVLMTKLGPLGILVTQPTPGVGEINVEWGNSDEALDAAWGVAVSRNPIGFRLYPLNLTGITAVGATQSTSGPPLGIPPLPPTGTVVLVRVCYQVAMDRYSLPIDANFTME